MGFLDYMLLGSIFNHNQPQTVVMPQAVAPAAPVQQAAPVMVTEPIPFEHESHWFLWTCVFFAVIGLGVFFYRRSV